MVPYFPKTIANKGVLLYALSLLVISFAFMNYVMEAVWIVLGIAEVLLFFMVSNNLTMKWKDYASSLFIKNLFWTAWGLRVAWVIFSFFFYTYKTGVPFEYGAADSLGYHEDAVWLANSPWQTTWNYLFTSRSSYSDSGYCLYLTLIYKIFGPNILIARILKALYGAVTCVLIFKLASRSLNVQVGKMAGVFAMLMPNMILYCGLHLKETEMVLLIVLFLERADFVLRSKKIRLWDILIPLLIAGGLFLFRTVIGMVALFSFMTALVFSPTTVVKRGRKAVLTLWIIVGVSVLAGGTVMNEVEELWIKKSDNQESKRLEQTMRGNQWAKYATGTVMAPMVFVLPFSTMVDTDQENQTVMHGGNYVRNFMGVFAIIAIVSALFVNKRWRDFALVGSFLIAYLLIIAMSAFSNSERFLFPGLPGLILLWAYGISELNAKNYKYVKLWYFIVPVMEIGWAVFKLGSRGLF